MITRPIPNFSPYEAGDDGHIYRDGRRLAQRSKASGYQIVTLSCSGKISTQHVHRLVCAAFHGLPASPDKTDTRHIDGQRDNNVPSNLSWSTHRENEEDKLRHGTRLMGDRAPWAKMSEETVLTMRSMAANRTMKEIAKHFGISERVAADAMSGRRWKHLPGAIGPRETVRRFSETDIVAIRALRGNQSQQQVAAQYGVAPNTIWQIWANKTYRNFPKASLE